MSYEEASQFLESLMPTQVSPGLERLAAFLNDENNPQDACATIHVAGTNGKGSVVAISEECLRQAGIHTGRFTGPHLLNWTERIQMDGKEIDPSEFAGLLGELREKDAAFTKRHPEHISLTWFEFLSAMAFEYFQRNAVDTTVLEVGLGGRWDATNTINKPVVSAIVSIDLDHTQILGDTISAIAAEKAEIIKEQIPVVTACSGEALSVIQTLAEKRNAPLLKLSYNSLSELQIEITEGDKNSQLLDYVRTRLAKLELNKLSGTPGYQRLNAHVAAVVLAVYEYRLSRPCLEHFHTALANFFWPGRLQYFPKHKLLVDGAHNEAGARALRNSLDELFPKKEIDFVLSFYKTKHFEKILPILLRPGDRVFASQAEGQRAVIPPEEIVNGAKRLSNEANAFGSLTEAVETALKGSQNERLCVAAGSFASVAAALLFMGYSTVEASRMGTMPLLAQAST